MFPFRDVHEVSVCCRDCIVGTLGLATLEGGAVRFDVYQGNNDCMRARDLRVEEREFSRAEAHVKFCSSDKGYGFMDCNSAMFEG